MKKNVKTLIEKLLAEKGVPPAPPEEAPAAPPAPEGGDEGGGLPPEGPEPIANENGSISYTPSEEGSVTEDVISFLKAVKATCGDCWPEIEAAVAEGLQDGEEDPGFGDDMLGKLGAGEEAPAAPPAE